jgi:REP element-mobilizing transposase RayT
MFLNGPGEIVDNEWRRTGDLRPNVDLDEYVIMPDHFHGILIMDGPDVAKPRMDRGAWQCAPTKGASLGDVVRGFKSSVTKKINVLRQTPGVPVWQRNFHDRIIKDADDLKRTREYILNNPLKWKP